MLHFPLSTSSASLAVREGLSEALVKAVSFALCLPRGKVSFVESQCSCFCVKRFVSSRNGSVSSAGVILGFPVASSSQDTAIPCYSIAISDKGHQI